MGIGVNEGRVYDGVGMYNCTSVSAFENKYIQVRCIYVNVYVVINAHKKTGLRVCEYTCLHMGTPLSLEGVECICVRHICMKVGNFFF